MGRYLLRLHRSQSQDQVPHTHTRKGCCCGVSTELRTQEPGILKGKGTWSRTQLCWLCRGVGSLGCVVQRGAHGGPMPCAAMKRGAGLEEKLPGSADLEQGVHPRKTRVHLKSPCSCTREVSGSSLWPGEHFVEFSLHVKASVPCAKTLSPFRATQQSATSVGGFPSWTPCGGAVFLYLLLW